MTEKIQILPYDPTWPDAFERERPRVESALLPWLSAPVEHIGSTAVPGLAAKPIIDMMARVEDLTAAGIVASMSSIGWVHVPEPGAEALSFCYPSTADRTHHLHIYRSTSDSWPRLITFREHLRTHPDDAATYAQVKLMLAEGEPDLYHAGKAPFIEALS